MRILIKSIRDYLADTLGYDVNIVIKIETSSDWEWASKCSPTRIALSTKKWTYCITLRTSG